MANAALARLGSIVISVHNSGTPTAQEFQRLITELGTGTLGGVLAFSTGWSPGSQERNALRKAVGGARVAVMIESTVGRMAISVMSVFIDIKGFALDQPLPALEFLGVPAEQRAEAMALLERLKLDVGVVTLKASA
ncbi:MAG: hypothetical protein U0228_07280 [Myxococcaceae bacterium]